ncbi:hypothetical protein C8R43DRAFT_369338 [Mycena crocata]|nr:hypothetical protein C8R43DRAFT_369338 [Mycena crocata]
MLCQDLQFTLLGLAIHRVHPRVVGIGSAVLKHDVSSSREQAEPAGPAKICRGLTLRQTCNDKSTVSNFNNPNRLRTKRDRSISVLGARNSGGNSSMSPSCYDPTRFPAPANGFDSTGCTCSAATRRPSYAANLLDANPALRIDSTRIQCSESTQLGRGAGAAMRLRLGWNDPRISARLDVHGAGLGMQRLELRCPRRTRTTQRHAPS